jgi:hypothetical protein
LKFFNCLLLIGFLLFTAYRLPAQSTVFNMPSTDVLPAKRLYLEADFTAHFSAFQTGGFQSYGPRIVYGLNNRMEVGINAFYTRTAPAEPFEIQPNFKFQFYHNEEKGLALAAGTLISIPLTHRADNPPQAMTYAVASKTLKGSYGPRFSAGGYALIGSLAPETSRKGLLLGYEQPLSKRLSFITDWSTGNNDYGYVAVGVGLTLTRKSSLYLGYNIGNQGRSNNSLGIYYGFNF